MVVQSRDALSKTVRLIVGLLLLAVILAFVDIGAVTETVKEANFLCIVAALALLPVNLLLESVKWRLLLSTTVRTISTGESIGSVLAGYALGFITPARLGDYAGRVLYLGNDRRGETLVMTMLDRLYSVWIYMLVGTIVLGFQLRSPLPGPPGAWRLTFVVGAALSLIVSVFVLRPSSVHAVGKSLPRWRPVRGLRRHFLHAGSVRMETAGRLLILSALRYGVICTQFVFLVLAFAPESPVLPVYAGVTLVFFAKTIIPSVSLFDLGIRESAAILFLGLYGVAPAAGLSASLLLFAVNLTLPALIGTAFAPGLRQERRRGSARGAGVVEARTA